MNLSSFTLNNLYQIYGQFLSFFPDKVHGLVSLVLAILIVYGIYKIIKRQFIYIILLVILLPASVPILKNIWEQLLVLIKFLLSKR